MTTNKSTNPNVLFRAENFSRGQKVRVNDQLHPLFSRDGRIDNISPHQTICVVFIKDDEPDAMRVWFYSHQLQPITAKSP